MEDSRRGIYRGSTLLCCKTSDTRLLQPLWNENWVRFYIVIILHFGNAREQLSQVSDQADDRLGLVELTHLEPNREPHLCLDPGKLGNGERGPGVRTT